MLPALALTSTNRDGTVRRISMSENHREYLANLRSRKAALLREERAKASRWCLDENQRNCRSKIRSPAEDKIQDESFETIRNDPSKRRNSSYIPQHIPEDIFARPHMEDLDSKLENRIGGSKNFDKEKESLFATLRIGCNGRIDVNNLPHCLLKSNWVSS